MAIHVNTITVTGHGRTYYIEHAPEEGAWYLALRPGRCVQRFSSGRDLLIALRDIEADSGMYAGVAPQDRWMAGSHGGS